jgi:predicted acyl esterase
MKNLEMKVDKTKLTITVDLAKTYGLSGSGKSEIIASTEGNVSVEGADGVKVGINIYRPASQ